jgi:uncharacterized membrane protein YtjA (UPF0391 family)
MLGLAITFFILAIVAAVFGLGFVSSAFAGLAKILLIIFLILAILSFLFGRNTVDTGF